MIQDTGFCSIALIILNLLFSWQAFRHPYLLEQYGFRVEPVLVLREYKRIISSGFLHVSWPHLIFNMLTLYLFGEQLEQLLGIPFFLLLYFCSLAGGNLLALFIHRHNSAYGAVGASGAICGVVFACIALFPGMRIGLIYIPFTIPAWAYGIAYLAYTIYGIRSRRDRIGHEAHLGGGVTGLIIAILIYPSALLLNTLPIVLIMVPSVIFLVLLFIRPRTLLEEKPFQKAGLFNQDDKYNARKRNSEEELNKLLDKISKKGIDSLSKKEREKLKQYSGNK